MIGEELRKFRKEKRLTLKEVEAVTGFSQSHMSQIELGDRQPTLSILVRLADLYEVSKLHLYRIHGLLDETDILQILDENKRLHEALQKACDSLGADINDYLEG